MFQCIFEVIYKMISFQHGAPAFTAPQQDRAIEVLKNRAKEREVKSLTLLLNIHGPGYDKRYLMVVFIQI